MEKINLKNVLVVLVLLVIVAMCWKILPFILIGCVLIWGAIKVYSILEEKGFLKDLRRE